MARMREKYGSGVAGLPLSMRVAVTAAVAGPSGYFAVVTLFLVVKGSVWAAGSLMVAVVFAIPAYVLLPTLWQRTEESVRTDWRSHGIERQLARELQGDRSAASMSRDPLPRRW